MKQQKHQKPKRDFTIREDGYITKTQLGKRGTILSESQLLDFEVDKSKLGQTMRGVTVVTVEDSNRARLFRYNDIEKAEKELMLENFHNASMRKKFCKIWNIEMEVHPYNYFSHYELLKRQHWTPERIEKFLSCQSFSTSFLGGCLTYPIYLKLEVNIAERSAEFRKSWRTEEQQRAEAGQPTRKKKITPTRLISERGWTRGLIDELLGEPDIFMANPHNASGPPMRLYFLDRVEHIEQTSDVFKSRRKDRRKSPIKRRNPSDSDNI